MRIGGARCIRLRSSCVSCARSVRSAALIPVWIKSMSIVPVVGSMADPCNATCAAQAQLTLLRLACATSQELQGGKVACTLQRMKPRGVPGPIMCG